MNYKICYIDDNEEQLEEFKHILEKKGHELIDFLDTKVGDEELIEYLDANSKDIDLVLIDYKLSHNVEGWEVANKISNNDKFSHIPLVILTAYNDTDKAISCLAKNGLDYYIVKSNFTKENCNEVLSEIFNLNSVKVKTKLRRLLEVEFKKEELQVLLERSQNKTGNLKIKAFFDEFEENYSINKKGFRDRFEEKVNILLILDEILEKLISSSTTSAQKSFIKPLCISALVHMVIYQDIFKEKFYEINNIEIKEGKNFIDYLISSNCMSEFASERGIEKFYRKIGFTKIIVKGKSKNITNFKLDGTYDQKFKFIDKREDSLTFSERGIMTLYEIVKNKDNYKSILNSYKELKEEKNEKLTFLDPVIDYAIDNQLLIV